MNSRERVIKVLKLEEVDRIPRDVWALPGITMFRKDELEELLVTHPNDFDKPVYKYGQGKRCKGNPAEVGSYTDAWGCEWHVGEPGVVGEVKNHPMTDWSALETYELPWELLENADISEVNPSCRNSDKFMLVWTETRLFERMQFLRGTENLYIDLALKDENAFKLRDMLHEFFVKEMEMWTNTDVDGVCFIDDWGSQNALLISPDMWRRFFKPLYKDYCDILHKKGKFVFFHSDGNIESIFPDLIEVGIDAINSQLFCMDVRKLSELYSGKITFWGEIDRQYLLPFGTENEVRMGVRSVANALLSKKRTGVIAQCEWGVKDPKANIAAVYDEWNKF